MGATPRAGIPIPLAGRPLPLRAGGLRPSAETYLVATRGPLPYMLRLREIEQRTNAEQRYRSGQPLMR